MYRQEIFQLQGEHHHYVARLAVPNQPAPESGYPVLYILDGNAYFTMFQEILKLQSRRSEKTGIEPMLLVGIGYESDQAFPTFRVYDFTPPPVKVELPAKPDGSPWPDHGGAALFLHFLQEQLISKVDSMYQVDKQKQTIFGHSLGGLFVLYTLFQAPSLFTHYFACSPSIWWNQRAVLALEDKHDIVHVKGVFIAAERVAKHEMYEQALSLYERLKVRHRNLHVEFDSPEDENHMSIVPAVFSKGLRSLHSKISK